MPDFKPSDNTPAKSSGKPFSLDPKDLAADARAWVSEQEDRLAPPGITEARCHVCQSDYRTWIEAMLVKGHSYVSIGERIPGKGGKALDRRSISNHHKNHMKIGDAAIRAVLEDEADLMSQNFEEGVRGAITARGILEVAMRKGYDDIINNISSVEPKDLIQIIKLKAEMDTHSAQVAVDEARSQVTLFVQAIRNIIGADQQKLIVAEVQRLRAEGGINAQLERPLEPEVVDAEVIDD